MRAGKRRSSRRSGGADSSTAACGPGPGAVKVDFGRERWDLVAIIYAYALEKRSVHRVRDALKPGGLVVIEAGHSEKPDSVMEYQSNELLEIFSGFRILKYEETVGAYDWGPEQIRLVRLVAQKPR